MVDIHEILNNLDIEAVVLPDDKFNECNYFHGLLSQETDRDRFRWLLGAFLNACYGFLEYKAAYFHYSLCNSKTGEPVEDWESLDALKKYVRVSQQKNKSGFIKTSGLSELMQKLYQYRAISTHDGGIEIMQVGDDLPNDFHIGKYRIEGVPAIQFCNDVLAFFSNLETELKEI